MEMRLNLASRSYLDRRSARRWMLLVAALLAVLLAVNSLYAYRSWQQLQQVDARLAEAGEKLAARHGQVRESFSAEAYAQVMGRVAAANELIAAEGFRWTGLLGRFEGLLPDQVSIRSLQPDFKERSLKVSAVAADVPAMTAFIDALLASAEQRQVYLLSQGPEDLPDGSPAVQFSLVIREAF